MKRETYTARAYRAAAEAAEQRAGEWLDKARSRRGARRRRCEAKADQAMRASRFWAAKIRVATKREAAEFRTAIEELM